MEEPQLFSFSAWLHLRSWPRTIEPFRDLQQNGITMNIRTLAYSLLLAAGLAQTYGQPVITKQPTNASVSLGASATFQVSATSTSPPIRYQWRFASADLAGQTKSTLNLTNIHVINTGDYDAVLTDGSGSATSRVAHLEVDPTFTKITAGRIVNDGGYSFGCAWGDYTNDGFIDLFVANAIQDDGSHHDFLYRNNGDGTFTRVTSGNVAHDGINSFGGAWADYDNDGNLDLIVAGPTKTQDFGPNRLYRNNGDGTFTRIQTNSIATQTLRSHSGIWADVNNDGLVDLIVSNFTSGNNPNKPPYENYVFYNKGAGNFDPLSLGEKLPLNGDSWNLGAADFNNDGWVDLMVPQGGAAHQQNSLLYTNAAGSLVLVTNSIFSSTKANSVACAWGDYDNDGFIDLFVSNFFGQNNSLYHNSGDGTFTLMTNSIVSLDGATSVGCAWGDYDNDGWLDLFVANLGPVDSTGTSLGLGMEKNFLYHNNGNGTFTKVTSGSLVTDLGYSTGCAWGDYDNDGFLDLFVSNGWSTKSENNFLYRNNGNTNNWISFRLVGTVSNRSAIGAKVRLKTTIEGKSVWQMREISGGSNYGSQNDLRANFGLGSATNVELLRIEWPSGIVQTMTNVPANQFMVVTEHQEAAPGTLAFQSIAVSTNGVLELEAGAPPGFLYLLESSTSLTNWSWLGVRTNQNGAVQWKVPGVQTPKRFFRFSAP